MSVVRELHVYGTAIPVHARDPSKFQHQGFGMLLMEEAARIAREEHGSTKIAVISGARVLSSGWHVLGCLADAHPQWLMRACSCATTRTPLWAIVAIRCGHTSLLPQTGLRD